MEGSHGWHYCPHQCYRAPECSKAVGHLQLVLPRGRPTMTISPSAVTLLCHVGAKAGHRPWPGGPLDSRGARGAAWLPPTLLMAQVVAMAVPSEPKFLWGASCQPWELWCLGPIMHYTMASQQVENILSHFKIWDVCCWSQSLPAQW